MIWLGSFLATSSALTWAIGVSTYAALEKKVGPFSINFARTVLGVFCFGVASFLWGDLSSARLENMLWLGGSVLGSYTLGDSVFLVATRSIGVTSALAIASCYPFWAALAGALWLNQPMTLVKLVGLALVVLGTVNVILAGKKSETRKETHTRAQRFRGICLAIFVSMFWAGNSFCAAKGAPGMSMWDANFVRMCTGFVLNGFVVAAFRLRPLPWRDLRANSPIFVLETFGGSAVYVTALSLIPLGIAATLASLAPLFSVPIAIAQGRERFSAQKLAGILFALAGLTFLLG